MKTNKKFLAVFAVLFCVLMLISICTACGSSAPNAAENKQASAASENPLSSLGNSSGDEKVETKKLGYIKSVDVKTGVVAFDQIEWITIEDEARIKELGLNAEADFPDGFYIYNPSEQTENLKLSQNAEFCIHYWNGVGVAEGQMMVDGDKFVQRLKQTDAVTTPWHLTIQHGSIVKIEEQYLP